MFIAAATAPEIRFPHLGIEIGHLPQDLLTIGNFSIKWYGLFVTIAVFAGLFAALREAKQSNQNPDLYFDFFFIVVVACVIGARVYYVIFAWDDYKDDLTKIFAFREGGLAIYGAIIAAITTAFIYNKIKKYDPLLFIDTGIFGLILGQAIGRYGNFFNREAFGGYTNTFLAMQYRSDTVRYGVTQNIRDNIVLFSDATYIQVHPTFLYESLWNIGLFVILQFYKKKKAFTGEIFMLYLLGYGVGRFWIEGLRTDQLLLFGSNIAVSQLLSAGIALFAFAFIVYKRISIKKGRTEQPVEETGLELNPELQPESEPTEK